MPIVALTGDMRPDTLNEAEATLREGASRVSTLATTTALWVRTAPELAALAGRLGAEHQIALDTEGDSLHHYPELLALLQLARPSGEAWLVDPLALDDLAALGPVFADPGRLVVLHAGDNDLAHLKRRHGLAFASIFDTSIAARFLGVRGLGLDALLLERLGVTLPPSRQKDDWSARPLSPAQEAYAVADVLYLPALRASLVDELQRAGRLAWVEEECAALAAQSVAERVPDPDGWSRLKGASLLSPSSLAALRELHELRERLARAADRPPFKILGDDTLVRLAGALPADPEALAGVPGCTPRVIGRWGPAILQAVGRAWVLGDAALPRAARPPRPSVPGPVRRRIEALRQWRAEASPRVGLEPGLLLPNRLIGAIAHAAPRDGDELARVDGVRRWRVAALGAEILAALGPA